ncbi:flavin reductase family protein [Streptomyces sp. 150FB]|uniref:flavin reductase family protein n=1 Tax=Streptomyces sp. 150FB TaxID=1576605 RepID=UPI0006988784|nr:flavin reductase family protein [Streptomyces sp. 150FB]
MPHVIAGARTGGSEVDQTSAPRADRCLDFYAGLASGIAVVTAPSDDGPVGTTVSTVTSLSAEPPLLLVCLSHTSRTLAAITPGSAFAVHLLGEEQGDRARLFASASATPAERFAAESYEEVLGVPVLADTYAWSICVTEEVRAYGDHCLVVGRVAALHMAEGRPLIWHDRAFHTLVDGAAR